MDRTATIKGLRKQRAKLDHLIRKLESQKAAAAFKNVKRRRVRKLITVEERSEVAKRMRRHWADGEDGPRTGLN